MTVSSSVNVVRAQGNGSTTEFSFTFPVLSATHLEVYKVVRATNTLGSALTYGVDYTVALNTGTDGGTVTFTVAPTALQDSLIRRVVPLTQTDTIPVNAVFRESLIAQIFDKVFMALGQIQEEVDRCLKVGLAETDVSLDTLIEDVQQSVTEAAASAAAAAASASAAATSNTNAGTAKTAAEAAQAAAEAAQAAAEAAADSWAFGTPVSKSFATAYLAATDGIVWGSVGAAAGYDVTCYMDGNNPPTTAVMRVSQGSTDGFEEGTFCFPVKAGQYYKVTISSQSGGSNESYLFFTPMGA